MTGLSKNEKPRKKNRDPIVLFLQESIKLTVVLYVVVFIMSTSKSLTGDKEKLVFIEHMFEFTKTWGFVLLLIERFLRILSFFMKGIVKSIIEIIASFRKMTDTINKPRG